LPAAQNRTVVWSPESSDGLLRALNLPPSGPRTGPRNRYRSTTAYVEFPGIVRIAVSPKEVRVGTGDAVAVTVMATLHGGAPMKLNDLVRWTPANPDVAVMRPGHEEVSGIAPGTTSIDVFESSTGWSETIDVTVLPPVLVAIEVIPLGETIPVGDTLQFAAAGRLDRRQPQRPHPAHLAFIEARRDQCRSIRPRYRQGPRPTPSSRSWIETRASSAAWRSRRRPEDDSRGFDDRFVDAATSEEPYLPLKRGARFCTQAACPSRRSADSIARWMSASRSPACSVPRAIRLR
jgi:hypothetical protein